MDGCTALVGQSWPKSSGLTFKEDQVVRGHTCKSNYPSGVSLKAQLRENIGWEMLSVEDVVVSLEQMAVLPSVDDFICISQKCRKGSKLAHAKHLHVHVCQNGLEAHEVLGNYLVPMFVECGSMSDAQKIFDRLALRNENSWTCLIQGYIGCGDIQLGLDVYQKMQEAAVHPSRYTFVVLLKACAMLKSIKRGQGLHAGIVNEGYESDVFLASSLVDLYVKCGSLAEAHEVFNEVTVKDIVLWNAIIAGYVEHDLGIEALICLEQMHLEGISMDAVTAMYSLKACGSTGDLDKGRQLHAEIVKKGFEKDPFIGNTLVLMYGKCGSLSEAQEVFATLETRDVYSWTALVGGYADMGLGEVALNYLAQMQLEGVSPDVVTFACSLKACCSIRVIDKGQKIHMGIVERGFDRDPYVCSALMDMYINCGFLAEAREVFDNLPVRDVVSWSTLITGYTENMLDEEALNCLEQMQIELVSPNAVTYLCILNACSSTVAIERGYKVHAEIAKVASEMDSSIGNALVDLYAKRGSLAEACKMFEKMPVPDVVSWTAIIAGHAEHGLGEEALVFWEKMELDDVSPNDVTFIYSLKACGQLGAIGKGQLIHCQIVKRGFEEDAFVGNALVDMYARCGSLVEAREVFDKVPTGDVILWTTLIAGYAEHGIGEEALRCLEQMKLEDVSPDCVTFVCSLNACSSIGICSGQKLHTEIVREGLEKNPLVCSCLVDMYAEFGSLAEAQDMFHELSEPDQSSWNAILSAYVEHGLGEEALNCLEQMQVRGVSPDAVTYTCILKACGNMGIVDRGQEVYDGAVREGLKLDTFVCRASMEMHAACEACDMLPLEGYTHCGLGNEVKQEDITLKIVTPSHSIRAVEKLQEVHTAVTEKGFEKDSHVANTLVSMYARCGSLSEAQEVFHMLPDRDVVSWTALMAGYADHGLGEEALSCLGQMQLEGVAPNAVAFVCSLRVCGSIGVLDIGQDIHAQIVKEGFEGDPAVCKAFIDMYAKHGSFAEAGKVFNELPNQDLVLWTSLIAGYAERKACNEALDCMEQMQLEGVCPDVVTFVCVLKACGKPESINKGHRVHTEVAKCGFEKNLFIGNALVNMYIDSDLLAEALEVFDNLPVRDAVLWNTLIAGYVEHMLFGEAFECLEHMQLEGVLPSPGAFACILKACGSIGRIDRGHEIYAKIVEEGIEKDPFVGNTLVDMYAKCGFLTEAKDVFDMLPIRDVISWTAMIAGYAEHGLGEDALSCLEKMQAEGISPDVVTYVCSLKACGNIGAIESGQKLHAEIVKKGFGQHHFVCSLLLGMYAECGGKSDAQAEGMSKQEVSEVIVGNALIDMYGKCGIMCDAQQVFDAMPTTDLVTWNGLIMGYARRGESEVVFHLFERMRSKRIGQDGITFLGVLTACSHAGLTENGHKYFEAMSKLYSNNLTLQHHNCMIDLLGRAGQLDEAVVLLEEMPFQPDLVTWQTVLGACCKWGDVELGRQAFEHVARLDKKHAAAYILMLNMYSDGFEEEELKGEREVWKEPEGYMCRASQGAHMLGAKRCEWHAVVVC